MKTDENADTGRDVVKISANLPKDAVEALRAIASTRGVSMTEVLRSAIATEKFISEVKENDGKVMVKDKNGEVSVVLFR